MSDPRVAAILGPTNTGKTHYAIDRLCAHKSGMIGFPLRLLARENYDRMVRAKGADAVALITGEEKILPRAPQYYVCTVESMPLDVSVELLAVDEIQLCADPERGHVFTDRLLHARGQSETLFLGAATIDPLIRRLVPGIEVTMRERLSTLSYDGAAKLTRLPRRSAIVAFSAADVYEIAEIVRRQRGGTAVVMGALSPRTRNAQVELYQSGEVDYLVATDAIGMGLNMNIDHVAFARLSKFDGVSPRRLRVTEIAQIAGRAGRGMADGTFGVTGEVRGIDEETVARVEGHRFEALDVLRWRNTDLDFASPQALLKSLDRRPDHPALMRAREAHDQMTLAALAREPEIAGKAAGGAGLRLLWDVCQVPDFRKTLSDHHIRLVAQLYHHLSGAGTVPTDYVADQLARLEPTPGMDIDLLMTRLAHVRTWTYVAHRPGWLAEASLWQEKARAMEDALSDHLHDQLTSQFVDRRSALLVRSLKSGRDLLAGVQPGGEVIVEGHRVGKLEGLRFAVDPEAAGEDRKAVESAARRALKDEFAVRVGRIQRDPDHLFELGEEGEIKWRGGPLARLVKGELPLAPGIQVIEADMLEPADREKIRARLAGFVEAKLAELLAPFYRLGAACRNDADLGAAARGIAWRLLEAHGTLARDDAQDLIGQLDKDQRHALWQLGVRMGARHIYLRDTLKPRQVALRDQLWRLHHGLEAMHFTLPAEGRSSALVNPDAATPPEGWDLAIGYPRCADRLIRVDLLDRMITRLYDSGKDGIFKREPALANMIGVGWEELDGIVETLGFERVEVAPPETPAPETPEAETPEPETPVADMAPPAAAAEQTQPQTEQPGTDRPESAPEAPAGTVAGQPAEQAGEQAPHPTEKKPPEPVHAYRLKRTRPPRRRGPRAGNESRPDQAGGKPGARAAKGDQRGPKGENRGKGKPAGGGGPRPSRPPREKQPDPNSPFAVLSQLLDKK